VLLRTDRLERNSLPLFQRGEHLLVVVAFPGIVHTLHIDRHETRVGDGRTAGAEDIAFTTGEIRGNGVDGGVDHLAGDGALPDKLVEPGLILGKVALQCLRGAQNGGGANRLMGLLGVLRLGFVEAWLFRQMVSPIAPADKVAQLGKCLISQVNRVGSHVGDQANSPATGVYAFIQLLGGAHGALGGEAQLTCRLLLKGGGGEGG